MVIALYFRLMNIGKELLTMPKIISICAFLISAFAAVTSASAQDLCELLPSKNDGGAIVSASINFDLVLQDIIQNAEALDGPEKTARAYVTELDLLSGVVPFDMLEDLLSRSKQAVDALPADLYQRYETAQQLARIFHDLGETDAATNYLLNLRGLVWRLGPDTWLRHCHGDVCTGDNRADLLTSIAGMLVHMEQRELAVETLAMVPKTSSPASNLAFTVLGRIKLSWLGYALGGKGPGQVPSLGSVIMRRGHRYCSVLRLIFHSPSTFT